MNELDRLAQVYERAKAEHAAAGRRLDEAHAQLIAACASRNEGAVQTVGDAYKVTVTYGVNRTVDQAALSSIRGSIPPALFDLAFEYAAKIKLSGLRYLQLNEPDTYAALAQAVTAKPAKPSVKVEAVEAMREVA